MGPHPAVAAIRLAVRRTLHELLNEHAASLRSPAAQAAATGATAPTTTVPPTAVAPRVPQPQQPPQTQGAPSSVNSPVFDSPVNSPVFDGDCAPLVLVACSGGADSMALASALAFEAPRLGVRAGAVTVDHGLQEGSAARAAEVAARLAQLGLHPVESVAVEVARGGAGPEAAAREARYAALDTVAERTGATAVLLGHTRDDQAETVLLGLARGSGTRSLSGMAAVSGAGRYRRPFLGVDRQTTRRACLAQSISVWDDPHNADPVFTRSRVRHEALPALEKALGKGVVEALARTAQLSRDDAEALDAWAAEVERTVRVGESASGVCELDTARLHALPSAVRRRVLRRAAIEVGAPAGSLFAVHVEEMDRLITSWRGQRPLNLPGRVEVARAGGRLVVRQGSAG